MKLALGTVQFGLNYGVANFTGRPTEEEVTSILADAIAAGIQILDTAHSYGESESVLGRCLPTQHGFRVVTKTPKFAPQKNPLDIPQHLRHAFSLSCERLRCARLYGLLVHDVNDLLGPNGETLWEAMVELRNAGQVQRIGASVYSGTQIDALLQRYPLELVQLPLSIIDQRLIQSGHLSRLAALGIEIHARSVFLQGALLMEVSRLPPHLAPLAGHIADLRKASEVCGMTLTQAALLFVADQPEISAVVCGVENRTQLNELVTAIRLPVTTQRLTEPSRWALDDICLLDPSQWNPR